MAHADIPADGGWHRVAGTPVAAIAATPDTVRIDLADGAEVEVRAFPAAEPVATDVIYVGTVVAGAAMWHVVAREVAAA